MTHATDTDCTIDPATDCCTICGVDHSGECPDCHGRGFHRPGCPELSTATFTDAYRCRCDCGTLIPDAAIDAEVDAAAEDDELSRAGVG